MVTARSRLELFVRLCQCPDAIMALATGVIQTGGGNDVGLRIPGRDELIKARCIDSYLVRVDIPDEMGRITPGRLDKARQVAF